MTAACADLFFIWNYYFEVTAHSHPLVDECSCVNREAVTAGNSAEEGITIAQLETGSARQQWSLIRAQDDTFYVQSMSSPDLYIGFNKMEHEEKFLMSHERQPFWLFWHPPPDGCGDRMLRLRHNKMDPVIVAGVSGGFKANEGPKNIIQGHFPAEDVIKGIHMSVVPVRPS